MKNPLRARLANLCRTLHGAVRHYPVELGFCLYGFVLYVLNCEWSMINPNLWLLRSVPLCLTLAYVLNRLFPAGRQRQIYYLAWIVALPALTVLGAYFLMSGERYPLTVVLLCPLAVLICRRFRDNRRFVTGALSYLEAGIAAGLFATVAALMFLAIHFSVTYIFFGLEGLQEGVAPYTFAAAFMLLMPLLLFANLDRLDAREVRPRKVVDALLNYVLTPALLAYTAILYLYFIQIVVTWSLPKGGIAVMVFIYMLVAASVKALQDVVGRPMYEWFFRRMSLYTLPPLLLFWSGSLRRVSDYALTGDRVYLLLFGGLMTLYALLFLSRRTGRYLYFCTAALVILATFLYVPALMPKRIAVRSQQARAIRLATELGMTDASGMIRLNAQTAVDTARTAQYTALYESLHYLAQTDPTALPQIGIENGADFRAQLPAGWDGSYTPSDSYLIVESSFKEGFDTRAYRHLYTRYLTTLIEDDTLLIRTGDGSERRFPLSELLRRQLAASGLTMAELNGTDLDETPVADSLCLLRTDSMTVVFRTLILRGEGDGYQIENAMTSALLIR